MLVVFKDVVMCSKLSLKGFAQSSLKAMQRAVLEMQWQQNGGGEVRAVYFSVGGKNIFDKTKMGYNALGIKRNHQE